MTNKIYLLFLLFIISSQVHSQTYSNLEGFYSLIDNSVMYADSLVSKSKDYKVIISLPPKLELLKTKIIDSFIKEGYKVSSKDSVEENALTYSLLNVEIDYSIPFKEGLFGDYLVTRNLSVNGSVLIQEEKHYKKPRNFLFNITDIVNLEEIPGLENRNINFTVGNIPEPKLITNLLEPILVVGTLIVTIILFFTIRGK